MKISSKIFAGVFAATLMTSAVVSSVAAADYLVSADYAKPKAGTVINDKLVEAETKVDGLGRGRYVDLTNYSGSKIDKYGLTYLKDAKLDVFLTNSFGDVFISADNVAKMKEFDFSVGIKDVTEKDTKIVCGNTLVAVPEKAMIIQPIEKGDFGFEFEFTFTATSKDYKNLYYIDDKGNVSGPVSGSCLPCKIRILVRSSRIHAWATRIANRIKHTNGADCT